jgi:hypothetical protein
VPVFDLVPEPDEEGDVGQDQIVGLENLAEQSPQRSVDPAAFGVLLPPSTLVSFVKVTTRRSIRLATV